ncbi:unnamed protein product [Moneuplotes crassus]|uniref:P53 and DNA damage-regulated protein 1 n=1 Tax=Euplotes crassus TaxID=5936 RepID=A0AAD2D8L8_EUPCR|nr:unnamed protein product [Moneuplotes crassus]
MNELNIPEETKKLLESTSRMEELAEEVLNLKQFLIEIDKKRCSNMEGLALFRKMDSGTNLLWMNFGEMFVRLPRKNVYKMLEEDQGSVLDLVKEKRNELKKKIRELLELQPKISDMSPIVQGLLLKEQEEILEEQQDY